MFNFHTQPDAGLTISPNTQPIFRLLNIQLCVLGKHWFYYQHRYIQTRLFHFLTLKKLTVISKVGKEEKQDEWKTEWSSIIRHLTFLKGVFYHNNQSLTGSYKSTVAYNWPVWLLHNVDENISFIFFNYSCTIFQLQTFHWFYVNILLIQSLSNKKYTA